MTSRQIKKRKRSQEISACGLKSVSRHPKLAGCCCEPIWHNSLSAASRTERRRTAPRIVHRFQQPKDGALSRRTQQRAAKPWPRCRSKQERGGALPLQVQEIVMFFEIDTSLPPIQGALLYVQSEHSIDFEPSFLNAVSTRTGVGGSASLSVGTLQIEVAVASGLLMYPWGYFPSGAWIRRQLSPVEFESASIRCVPTFALDAGVSYVIPESERWSTYYDETSGWLCSTDRPILLETVRIFEFASSVAASLDGNRLTSLWLRPSIVPHR